MIVGMESGVRVEIESGDRVRVGERERESGEKEGMRGGIEGC